MGEPETPDSLFQKAVAAITSGDVQALEHLLAAHPPLVRERLESPGAWLRDKVGSALDGFFQRPYLLWFVAEDPVLTGKLPPNIADVTRTIIQVAKRQGVDSLQEQLNYALTLVCWSSVASQCQVQIALIDLLVDEGASTNGVPENALVNGHIAAARRLVERGAPLTLATALCLERWYDVQQFAETATAHDKQIGLVLAALNGKAEALRHLIVLGVDLDAFSTDIHSHATALHHAVWSGSLEAVKVIVEAGAKLDTRDLAHKGTPLTWAEYAAKGTNRTKEYAEIATYLRQNLSN